MVQNALAVVTSRGNSIPISHVHTGDSGSGSKYEEHQHGHGDIEEEERARIERLGRERPPEFKSFIAEVCFCYSILASVIMAVSQIAFGYIHVQMRLTMR